MDIVPLSSGLRFPDLHTLRVCPGSAWPRASAGSVAGEPKVSFLGLLIPAGALKRTSAVPVALIQCQELMAQLKRHFEVKETLTFTPR